MVDVPVSQIRSSSPRRPDAGLATTGAKPGGLAWCDLNGDGFPDALVNTANRDVRPTRLYFNDGRGPLHRRDRDPRRGLLEATAARSVICADLDGDGYVDFARNDRGRIEVYLNRGPQRPHSLELRARDQRPNQVIEATPCTAEGMAWIDEDRDGDLDLLVDDGENGLLIFENDGKGRFEASGTRPRRRPPRRRLRGGRGLRRGRRRGRRRAPEAHHNLWGTGTALHGEPQLRGRRATGKGGVAFCDVDADGDLDVVWADRADSEIWLNDRGRLRAHRRARGFERRRPRRRPPRGVACGDLDNDGDLDIVFSATSGPGYLFFNETPAGGGVPLALQARQLRDRRRRRRRRSLAFGDYDRDGDLDLLVNVDGGANQLWRSHANEPRAKTTWRCARRCLHERRFPRRDRGDDPRVRGRRGHARSGPSRR